MIEGVKARLYEKKAESQSMGTIIGIIIAVVAGLAVLTFIVTMLAPDGKVKTSLDDKVDEAFGTTTP